MPKESGNPDQFVLYDGEVILDFDEAKHRYTKNGVIVPSTTQITKAGINKEFLVQWSATSASKYVARQWREDEPYSQEAIDTILKRAKFHYKNIQEKATTNGTYTHEWIEEFVNYVLETGDKEPDLSNFEVPYTMEAISGVAAFLNWYYDNDVKFIAAEKKVYSLKYNYSGTYDLLAVVNGKLTVVDFKTSKDIYEDYFIQGAAYVNAYHEEVVYVHPPEDIFLPEDHFVEQFMVLQVPKNGDNYKTGVIYPEMYEPYFEVFKACRVVYDWTKKPKDHPWGDGSMTKPEIVKGKKEGRIYFPDYQS